MLDTILHRGPDGRGSWQAQNRRAALVHCRLAIVDLDHGHQPMLSGDGRVAIVYNGEVYGFKGHRRDLEASGYRFRTHCDTEVLLALYLRHGPDFLAKLHGEFAFVIYDGRTGRTLLARDQFGVKPLAYSLQKELLLFGSEVKAILAHPYVRRAIAPAALHRRMHGVMLPEETVFEGVSSLSPGTMMIVEPDGEMRTHRYADLDPVAAGTLHLSPKAAAIAFDETYTASVKDRLQGDVPVGIYLSGGVDSTATAAVMREITNAPLKAFTIGFRERGFAEAEQAAATAERLGLDHRVEPIGTHDLDAHFARSIWHGETPVMNAHGTAKLQLSARAARYVKVILAGEGADELHGGYAWQRHAGLLQAMSTSDDRQALKAFLSDNGAVDGVLKRATPELRVRFAGARNEGVPYAAMRASLLSRLMGRAFRSQFLAATDPDPAGQLLDWLGVRSPGARQLDDMTLSRLVATITDLPTYNLSYMGDRPEMANSIEGRLPFLDRRVADLLWQLPASFHINPVSNKTLVRGALARRGYATAERYKRVFLAPSNTVRGLFEGPMARRWLSKRAIDAAGIVRYRPIAIARVLHATLPRRSGLKTVLETFLMLVISAHLLDHLFCKDFEGSVERFSARPAQACSGVMHAPQIRDHAVT